MQCVNVVIDVLTKMTLKSMRTFKFSNIFKTQNRKQNNIKSFTSFLHKRHLYVTHSNQPGMNNKQSISREYHFIKVIFQSRHEKECKF